MVVGLSGSRYHQFSKIYPVVHKIIQAGSPAMQWAVGCCPTGLDQAARAAVKNITCQSMLFTASSRSPAALRARTCLIVQRCDILISFPFSANITRSGSWLAASRAAAAGKTVYVYLPGATKTTLPVYGAIIGWRSVQLPFFPNAGAFWSPSVSALQMQIFQEADPHVFF